MTETLLKPRQTKQWLVCPKYYLQTLSAISTRNNTPNFQYLASSSIGTSVEIKTHLGTIFERQKLQQILYVAPTSTLCRTQSTDFFLIRVCCR